MPTPTQILVETGPTPSGVIKVPYPVLQPRLMLSLQHSSWTWPVSEWEEDWKRMGRGWGEDGRQFGERIGDSFGEGMGEGWGEDGRQFGERTGDSLGRGRVTLGGEDGEGMGRGRETVWGEDGWHLGERMGRGWGEDGRDRTGEDRRADADPTKAPLIPTLSVRHRAPCHNPYLPALLTPSTRKPGLLIRHREAERGWRAGEGGGGRLEQQTDQATHPWPQEEPCVVCTPGLRPLTSLQ